jgi:CofH/MqnC C-terminal region
MMTPAEARTFLANPNLIDVGVRADDARRARHHDRVTFVRVAEVPVGGRVPATLPRAGEVRITGVPESAQQIEATIRTVASGFPPPPKATARLAEARFAREGGSPTHRPALTGFALHDLEELGALAILAKRMKGWGLHAIAEAALDRLANPAEAIRVVYEAGLPVARLTVRDPQPDPVAFVAKVRDVVTAVPGGAVGAFAPLARTPDPAAPTTGYDDVRLVALARLYLDTVDNIQVDWSLYGPKLAQVALTFGANDLDAVAPDPSSGNLLGPRRAPLEEVRRNIRAASFVPLERNGRFELLEAEESSAT